MARCSHLPAASHPPTRCDQGEADQHDEEGVEDDAAINLLDMMNGSPPICVHSVIWRILFFQRIFYVEGGNLIFSPISSIYQNKKNIANLSADEGPGQ